jgi:hypothetical protein
MPPSILKYFHHDWAPFQGVDFYNQIRNYDYFLRQLPSAQPTDLRINLEQNQYLFLQFALEKLNLLGYNNRERKIFSYDLFDNDKVINPKLESIISTFNDVDQIDLSNLLINDSGVELLLPTNDAIQIVRMICSIISDQKNLYKKSCRLYHRLKDEGCQYLKDQGFDFDLIHHLDMYFPLFIFLQLFQSRIENASPLIQTQICKFFQLKPSNWGEEE